MEPYKVEQDIKEKLEKRKIQPSESSWNKLANRLELQEKKKGNKYFWWIGIAASVVGIIWSISLFLNNDTEKIKPIIVETPTIIEKESNIKVVEGEIILVEEDVNKIKENKIEAISRNQIKQVVKTETQREVVLVKNSKEEQDKIANNENQINKKSIDLNKVKLQELTFEEQKKNDMVSQKIDLNKSNINITDAEIDALLTKAQEQLASNKIYNENTKTVDANILLQDVEEAIDKSFRDKVLEALIINYENLKTAVSQRND